jgi:hypothetical protein
MLLCHIIQILRLEINLILYKHQSTSVPKTIKYNNLLIIKTFIPRIRVVFSKIKRNGKYQGGFTTRFRGIEQAI